MRTLLRLIRKYSDFLLFLLLETAAVIFLVRGTVYQQSRITSINREISGFFYSNIGSAREYFSLKEVNEGLVLENSDLRNRLDVLTGIVDSSGVMRMMEDEYRYFYVPSKIVHGSVFKQYNYLTINKGRKQGVFKDMGVISDRGLVGIVLESSNNFATVIPILNRDFKLSAKIKSNNYAGILQWEGDSPLFAVLKEIPYHVNVTDGDTIITSGFSAIFPEGLLVGTIESHTLEKGNFYDITVKLSTNFQSLFHVNVIRNFYQEEQKQLEQEVAK